MKPEPVAPCMSKPVKPKQREVCMYCSRRFVKNRFWQKFCSSDCHDRYHRERK